MDSSTRSKVVELCDGKLPVFQKGMKLLLLNIRGLVNKMDTFKDTLYDVKSDIDIVCINETFLDSTILSNEIAIDGFSVERKDRTRSGGGVLFYISNNINILVVTTLSITIWK